MKPEFFSRLSTPFGDWGIFAGMEGVTAVVFGAEMPEPPLPPLPYDLAHAWEAYESGLADGVHLPLDLTASPAAQRLWLRVRHVPRGETLSLDNLAAETGLSAAEAESLLVQCPTPLVIPTYRVSAWPCPHPEVQQALLAFEAEHPRLPRVRNPWKKE